jgi:hypothetical protein
LAEWLAERRQAVPRPPETSVAPHPMPYRVVLRFRDGSDEVLNPTSTESIELHALADQWLTGRR